MNDPPVPASASRGGEIDLRTLTQARVGLGRTGVSIPTAAMLSFGLDHARARDAVHAAFDVESLAAAIASDGEPVIRVSSQVADRADYMRRPDLGRALDTKSRDRLLHAAGPVCDIAVAICDGLSPGAVSMQAPLLLHELRRRLHAFSFASPVIATGGRVALGDEIGALLKARLVIVLIGERPGLSTPQSLGAYLTVNPRPGLTDADRNCVSNIHPAGLSSDAAAARIAWLSREGLARNLTGVALKDDSTLAALPMA